MTRTFWLSFADPELPKGQQFKGACVIDVTEEEAATIKEEIDARFPRHKQGAEWISAALRKAWYLGCAQHGEVAVVELPLTHPAPRDRLLVSEELGEWGAPPRTRQGGMQ